MRLPALHSMQLRLLAYLSAGVTLVWLAAAAWTWVDARHELDELLDSHLAQAAALLVVQQSHVDDDENEEEAPVLHKYAPRVAFQVFHEGALVARSGNAGLTPMTRETRGFDTVTLDNGDRWRVFATRGSKRDIQVYVGEQLDSRDGILRAVLRGMLLPSMLALPLLAALMWWAVRKAMAPLDALGHSLRSRAPDSTVPLPRDSLPTEMRPMVDELNALLQRIEGMVASERRFTADAAHELRTPIAAIRTQAQVAMGAVDDADERRHALQNTLAGCDRAARLVDQLLTLARLDAPASAAASGRTDLSALARSVAADMAPQALARGQDLELQAPQPCPVAIDEVLPRVLLRNLLDNASRYAGDGARIAVSVAVVRGWVQLTVRDSGPGLSPAEMARLGERFFRVLGTAQTGSGLGWSIVRRIAQATGAQVEVTHSASLGGLQVQVSWPMAEPA
ncbi:ATP-binding protein [Rhodoferax sp. TBRC 17660]|uniref:histidine kinase n=1 Tax=Rhodoferax potami TaxID=3068338 RepID=A0ABU3KN03_9BURK|nr:ATP-binding protein [Rhodoferax sp. TBRC 17660]MDT7518728.1 ATP-binding protein [Rhodoferax sp. TBRC 17660]